MTDIKSLVRFNFRYFTGPYVALSLVLLVSMPIIFSISYLDMYQTARILEIYLVFNGMLILGPLFSPEEDGAIRRLILSKRQSYLGLLLIRLFLLTVILMAIITLNLIILKGNHCEFPFFKYLYGGFASAWILGSISVFFSGISGSTIIGYLVSFVYYMINLGSGSKYLGKFYLFSMLKGSVHDKIYLLCLGALLVGLGIIFNVYKSRKTSIIS